MEDRSTDTASQKRVVTRMLIVLCIIVGSVVIILAAVAYLILSKRWRQQSCELCSTDAWQGYSIISYASHTVADQSRGWSGGPDTTDRDGLIQNMGDEDAVTDGVVTASRRRGTRPGKKTRHKPSSKK